jgi:hypothetical protein
MQPDHLEEYDDDACSHLHAESAPSRSSSISNGDDDHAATERTPCPGRVPLVQFPDMPSSGSGFLTRTMDMLLADGGSALRREAVAIEEHLQDVGCARAKIARSLAPTLQAVNDDDDGGRTGGEHSGEHPCLAGGGDSAVHTYERVWMTESELREYRRNKQPTNFAAHEDEYGRWILPRSSGLTDSDLNTPTCQSPDWSNGYEHWGPPTHLHPCGYPIEPNAPPRTAQEMCLRFGSPRTQAAMMAAARARRYGTPAKISIAPGTLKRTQERMLLQTQRKVKQTLVAAVTSGKNTQTNGDSSWNQATPQYSASQRAITTSWGKRSRFASEASDKQSNALLFASGTRRANRLAIAAQSQQAGTVTKC